MIIQVIKKPNPSSSSVAIFPVASLSKISTIDDAQRTFIKKEMDDEKEIIRLQELGRLKFFVPMKSKKVDAETLEKLRGHGNTIQAELNKAKQTDFTIGNETGVGDFSLAIAEGAALGNYQFLKYFKQKDQEKKKHTLSGIHILDSTVNQKMATELQNLLDATFIARTLINEPLSYLTAVQFSKEMQQAGKVAGFTVEVLGKKQIEQLKMGGLLAVNLGSMDPPTFTIMEWKPARAKNKKPIVLIGKGVVFDTGGLSLKPTPGSMDEMKCDMSGGAAVIGALYALASNKIPVHVIGLVPATDNRPGMNAYVPQDIITMMDGSTVEVLNTDAEGRMILADALHYAKRYAPELVIDLATLTGAAVRAVGQYASAIMGTADQPAMNKLAASGMKVCERTVQFPLWKEYGEEMKSDIADLKNLGGANAGHITAGKFLEHFTDYPWIHIDIAGPAYINTASSYRTKGGTGVGVRMLYEFLKGRI